MSSTFTGEEDWDCPLCMEEMDLSDKNFYPCPCGYQICRFCWHKIREDGNQRCPACRKIYDENEAEFTPVPPEEINRMKLKKKAVRERREAAAEAELDKSPAGMALTNEIINSRKHLSEFRVVQKNLVYVIGISAKIAHEHILKEPEFFGQFGKIIKIVVNRKNFLSNNGSGNPPSASAYVTFARKEDAAKAIEYVDGSVYDDRVLRATYGTTKYCSYFLRGLTCQNPGCMYLHEPGEDISSYTKEQLTAGSQHLHSFIVDKSESANLRQFGVIMVTASPPAKAPIAPIPHRSSNDSPRPSLTPVSTVVPSSGTPAPPGLKPSNPVDIQKVPLVNDLSTNSFFDKISRMITASELEEFALMAPKGLAAFSPKSPPPPALNTNLGFFSLSSGQDRSYDYSNESFEKNPFRTASPLDEIVSPMPHSASLMGDSNSSCPSRQSFSFSNLPIRSPKPTSASLAALPDAPAPVKHIAVETLFPSDYKPIVPAGQESSNSHSEPVVKKFTTASRAMAMSTQNQSTAESTQNNFVPVSSSNGAKRVGSELPKPALPVLDQTPVPVTNKNIFDILKPKDIAEPVELPSTNRKPEQAAANVNRLGPVKVMSTFAVQPQSMSDLEKLARDGKLEARISGLEENMFRSRLEAESLEAKLKTLFEASSAGKRMTSRK